MKNRNIPSPILCAVALSLVTGTALAVSPEASLPLPVKSTPAPTDKTVPAATTGAAPVTTTRPLTYIVVAGDSFSSISKKFNTTIKKLKKLNNLTAKTVKPGQMLQIPPATVAATPAVKPVKTAAKPKTPVTPAVKTASAKPKATSQPKAYLQAQPVQDFDIPASTFASCPVPQSTPESDAEAQDAVAPVKVVKEKTAPVAKLVSPAEMAVDTKPKPEPEPKPVVSAETPEPETSVADASTPAPAETPAVDTFTKHSSKASSSSLTSTSNASVPSAPAPFNPPAAKLTSHSPSTSPMLNTPSSDWGSRFLQQARWLSDRGIEYDEDWHPPGESHSWAMDCSNTSRYLYKVTTGIQLPRTASDQYYYLHLQNKAWDVPQGTDGWADTNFLRQNLKPGDLLFWENTYRPERQPPITHVMVFLGTNDKGQWIMAGSQSSRGGEHNRRNGGPDIYVFNPSKPCGGYSTWMGLVHHQGRFCAYGRPLEADKSKLSVAAND